MTYALDEQSSVKASYGRKNPFSITFREAEGNPIDFDLSPSLKIGDKVKVELYHINKSSYDYYRTLLEAIGTGDLAPANPISNFGEQALGNFNTYIVFSDSTVGQ